MKTRDREKETQSWGDRIFTLKGLFKELTQKDCRIIVATSPKPEETEPEVPQELDYIEFQKPDLLR